MRMSASERRRYSTRFERAGTTRDEAKARAEVLAQPRLFRSTTKSQILMMAPWAVDVEFSWGGLIPTYRTAENIAVVTISGPLEHHFSWCWDSYERIICAVEDAMAGQDLAKAHEAHNWWKDDYQPLTQEQCPPAAAVVMCIDSPGGEAAGTMTAHRKLRQLSIDYQIPLYSYADETMCSAAYAIGSAAQEIWGPDTATIGSIGVVATLFDRTAANEKEGLVVELITSGSYKADGHADRPLTDGIRGRMQARVDTLAQVFWEVVANARGTTAEAVASLEAGVFVGFDAKSTGVADGIADWDKFLSLVTEANSQVGNKEISV